MFLINTFIQQKNELNWSNVTVKTFTLLRISAVKRLIVINRIQNNSFCLHNMCVCCVYLLGIYKYTHACIYFRKKKCLYIKYIYLEYKLYEYKYRHVNTCKYFQNIYCMCVYLYIHNKYTQNTHYANKTFIVYAINHD